MKFSFLRLFLISLMFLLLTNNQFFAQKYFPFDCDSDDWFGFCVDLSVDFAIFGSPTDEEYSGLIAKYKKFWNTGQFEDIENVLHEDFEIRMTPKYESEKGIDLFKENVTKWRTAYPDF